MERFFNKVSVGSCGCHMWMGARNKDGYGIIRIAGKNENAHRIAVSLSGRQIPKGLLVRHTCDIRACVNPEHLILGTISDNTIDMLKRGRSGKHVAKLTDMQVRHIIASKESIKSLMAQFSVSNVTIYDIRNGKRWKHLQPAAVIESHA